MYEKKNRTVRSSSHGWIYNRKRCESLCNAQEESIFHFNASLHRFSNLICKQTTVMCGGVRHTRKQTRIDHWCALKIFLLHICFGVRHLSNIDWFIEWNVTLEKWQSNKPYVRWTIIQARERIKCEYVNTECVLKNCWRLLVNCMMNDGLCRRKVLLHIFDFISLHILSFLPLFVYFSIWHKMPNKEIAYINFCWPFQYCPFATQTKKCKF